MIFFLIMCTYNSGALVGSLCSKVFFNRKAAFIDLNCKNPLAVLLVEGHKTALVEGHKAANRSWIYVSKKQIKEFEKGLREIAEFLERSPTQKEQMILNRLDVSLEASVNKIPEIMDFVQGLHPVEALYFKKIMQAVLAVFSKHIPTILKEDINQIDWLRMNFILKSIVAFDIQKPRFSLYKIKRAIEGRYSLKEFILCRV